MNNENYSKNLGKKTEYSASYDSSLLDPIPRDLGRSKIKGFSSSGELLSNVVYGGSRCSLLMSLHFFHSIDEANIFHNIR